MESKFQRREIIKLLGLAGFSLVLPSCNWDPEAEISESPENSSLDSLHSMDQDPLKKFDYFSSSNVSYFKKEDLSYREYNIAFNLRVQKNPQIIALCRNTEGVQEAVNYAIDHDLQICVKSGGHSFEGFSSNDGGIQINLTLMNSIEWLENDIILAQPACLLRELYDETIPKNRILPSGSCGTVGLGGIALGGGYGFFSRKYGLTCDHLVEVEMIDGNGKLINTQQNPDLLWALKGGGNGNFGIITQMKFKTIKAPIGFTRHRFKTYKLDVKRSRAILEKWFLLSSKLPDHSFSAFVLNGKTLTILLTHYESIDSEIEEMILNLDKICDKTSKGNQRDLATSLKTYYGVQEPIPFKNSSAGYYQSFEDIENYIDSILEKVISGSGLIYQINTLGGKINDPEFQKKSCYAHRDFGYLSELQAYWDEGENAETKLREFEEIQSLFYDNGIRRQYRLYPNLNFKNWEAAYWGEENYKDLQLIKVKYDPENRIHHPQSIQLPK